MLSWDDEPVSAPAARANTPIDEQLMQPAPNRPERIDAERIALRVNGKGDTIEVSIDSIVAITVDERGAASNNKRVLFIDREPVVIADVTLARLAEYGFPDSDFVLISRDCAINRTHAIAWTGSIALKNRPSGWRAATTAMP